jgi:putative sugar O-methyltransferase
MEFHASFLGGLQPFFYWNPNPVLSSGQRPEVVTYSYYTEDIDSRFHISAPAIGDSPRQNGVVYAGKIINGDTIRYQSAISNLVTMGIFDILEKKNRPVICEVGPGCGGLAFHFSKVFKKPICLLIDIPETLFIAGAYLIVNDPEASVYIYDGFTPISKELFASNSAYDYMLIPDFALPELNGIDIDLFINMLSFQEMPEDVIDGYVYFAYNNCSGFLYSDNWNRHPCNEQIVTSVESILGKYFDIFPAASVYNDPLFGDAYTRRGYQELRVFIGRSKKLTEKIPLNGYIKVVYATARIKTRGEPSKGALAGAEVLLR